MASPHPSHPSAPDQQRQSGVRQARSGRDHMSEYAEMMADIARTPRPSLWQRFTIALAGQR